MHRLSTIIAVATPPGVGGVGIIRLSGKLSKTILEKMWRGSGKTVDKFVSHKLYYGSFVSSSGEILDRGMAVWMASPHSYTGEEVVEIQVHGSPLILEMLVKTGLHFGAVSAEPGEFTKRAYLNGKLDLSQAEAVADLIHASGEAALKQARDHYVGRLAARIAEWQQELIRLRAFVEASIDFPEEDIELIQKEGVAQRLSPLMVSIQELLNTYEEGRLHREGVKVALVGRPNAGKSSLMNALLGEERAIVHSQAGTTRDVIEETLVFDGILFRLFDTAGLRDADQEVEAMGVALAQQYLDRADLILWVLDVASSIHQEDIDFLEKLDFSKTLLCGNKIDLGLSFDPKTFLLPEDQNRLVLVSAKERTGLDSLRERMVDWVKRQRPQEVGGLRITRQRHQEALTEALKELSYAEETLEATGEVTLVAHHLKRGHAALSCLTGSDVTEDLLDSIFREFCIGK